MRFSILIIGSGPAGYTAAIRAAQLGFRVALIDNQPYYGGTSANVGCTPAKALSETSYLLRKAEKSFGAIGLECTQLKADFRKILAHKQRMVEEARMEVSFWLKKNKIVLFYGQATILRTGAVRLSSGEGGRILQAEAIVIATGSKPHIPQHWFFDGVTSISSAEAMSLRKIPENMSIIGAGCVGVQMALIFARLGTRVRLVEKGIAPLPNFDVDIGRELNRYLPSQGIDLQLRCAVQSVEEGTKGLEIQSENTDDPRIRQTWTSETALIAVGRKPTFEGIGLERIGLLTHENGSLVADENFQTSADGIFAIGDVLGGQMTVQKAQEQAVFLMELLANQQPYMNNLLIPQVVHTYPEIATVGKTESDLIKEAIPFKVGKYNFKSLQISRLEQEVEGMVKVIAHAATDEILGVHIIGHRAAELIAEATFCMEFMATVEDVARIAHPNLSYSSAFREACRSAFNNRPMKS